MRTLVSENFLAFLLETIEFGERIGSWVPEAAGYQGTGLGRAAPCISSIPGDGARLRFGLLSEDNPGCVMKRRLWIGCIFLFFLQICLY